MPHFVLLYAMYCIVKCLICHHKVAYFKVKSGIFQSRAACFYCTNMTGTA